MCEQVGGDFNIIRNPREKNNERYDSRWPTLLNACIESLNLRELELSGRRFTWANIADVSTFEKLDRVLQYQLGTKISSVNGGCSHTRNFRPHTTFARYPSNSSQRQ